MKPVSLDKRLKAMSTEELAMLAGDLEELTKAPGWGRLVALLDGQAEYEEARATGAATAAIRAAKPLSSPEPLYRWVGKADGMRAAAKMVDGVLAVWATVQAQLEREEQGR